MCVKTKIRRWNGRTTFPAACAGVAMARVFKTRLCALHRGLPDAIRTAMARRFCAMAILSCLAVMSQEAAAQSWPSRTVTIVAPYSAGGITDILARVVAEGLAKSLGQAVIVQNVTGAGGHIGGASVARAAPDGYTLLMAAGAMIVASPNTEPDIVKYDTLRDLEPIAFVAELPVIMVVHPSVQGAHLKEFMVYARTNADKLNCASTGVGTAGHLACLQFGKLTGINIPHIPYKGAPEANADLLANRVQIYFGVVPTQIGLVREGKLRAYGVALEQRLATAPDIPTLREEGFPIAVPSWNSLFAPAGLPRPVATRLASEMQRILRDPEVRAKIEKTQSVLRAASGPDDLRQLISEDFALFRRLAIEAGIRKN